jgi:hypothetical protein
MAAPSPVTATPTTSTVLVNNSPVTFQAYTINGNNYFKLRDLAAAMTSTIKHFSVDWDGSAIQMISTGYYVLQGDELTVPANPAPVSALLNASSVFLNGKKISLTAYTIDGHNYFKLRDVGAALDFGVSFAEATNTIKIDATQHYYIGALLDLLQDSNNHARYDETSGVFIYSGMNSGFLKVNRVSPTIYRVNAEGIAGEE